MSVAAYKANQVYKTTSVQTASQSRLVAMLFEGAVKFMNQFVEAVGEGKVERAHDNSIKAQKIIAELSLALDHSKGGDVSRAIEAAYEDIRHRMMMSNIRKDVTLAQGVIADLESFKETWAEVFRNADIEPPSHQAQMGVSIRT